jgi:amidase
MTSWQEIAKKKKQEQNDLIPKDWLIPVDSDRRDVRSVPRECGLLSKKELEITELDDVSVLLDKLATGKWSSVEVTTAFYKRAIIAHQLVSRSILNRLKANLHRHQVNCLTEIFIEKALQWASERDSYLKETGRPIGPLHGLPISLKASEPFPLM